MNAFDGDFVLISPGAAKVAGWAAQNGTGVGVDK